VVFWQTVTLRKHPNQARPRHRQLVGGNHSDYSATIHNHDDNNHHDENNTHKSSRSHQSRAASEEWDLPSWLSTEAAAELADTAGRFQSLHFPQHLNAHKPSSLTLSASDSAMHPHSQHSQHSQHRRDRLHCVRFMGSVGGTLVQRGQWFPTSQALSDLRSLIVELCPRNDYLVSRDSRLLLSMMSMLMI
jgi:hypothetical protein